MKKILNLLLAIVIVTGCFAGCSQNNRTSQMEIYSKKDLTVEKIGDYGDLELPFANGEKIEILISTELTKLNDSLVVKELRKRTGADIDITEIPVSAEKDKVSTIIAGGDLPHIMNAGTSASDIGIQGGFVRLDENLDLMPNFKKIFFDETEKYQTTDFAKWLQSEDGHIYQFPVWDIQREVNHGFLYRKDILDKHGIKMWNSTDEFYETLKELKKLYPDSIPLTSKNKMELFMDFAGMWNIRSYKPWTPYFDEDTGLWKQSLTDPKMKEIADFIKKLYNEKLLDPEFLTITTPQWTSNMTNKNKSFISFDWIGRLDTLTLQSSESVPGYDLRFGNPIGEGKLRTLDKVWGGQSVANIENKEIAMKVLDYLLSESGAILSTLGIEGETYEIGENGKAQYLGMEAETEISTTTLGNKYGLFALPQIRYDKRSKYYDYTEREQEAQDLINNKSGGGYNPFDPVLVFTGEELEIVNEIQPKIKKAAEEFYMQYITGTKTWEEWVKQSEKLGSDELVKIYNQAYVRNYK